MVAVSPRFAVLASLCAVLSVVFPSPAEAAHLYGSRSMESYASSPYFQQRTRGRNGFLGDSVAAHKHDGENDGHQAPKSRPVSDYPPLLRRYRPHDYNSQVQRPHDYANHKDPRSAFARSRYRRQPAYLTRRSSVFVSGEHGDMYSISRTPPRGLGHGSVGAGKQPSYTHNRRQVDQSNLVTGRIDIMGSTRSTGNSQRLASLAVDSTPVDWKSSQSSTKVFPLNASTGNQTRFIMMPADELSDVSGNESKHVTLATEVFDANSTQMVMYCATYDPNPSASSTLVMAPCMGTTASAALIDDAADPCADDEGDASSPNPHESQIFSYDPSSGRIQPISANVDSSGTSYPNDLASCGGARARRDNGNSSTSGRPSTTSTSTAPSTSTSPQAQDVTLVYIVDTLEVPAASSNSSSTTSTTIASIGQTAAFTTTITTTVVATVTSSGTPTRTVTPAQAAMASVSTSSASSQSTIVVAPSAASTATTMQLSLSPSSVSTTTTSSAPANADGSLEVEVVGVTSSATGSSSSGSTSATTAVATSSYSSSSTSASLDALAVAKSVANAMAPRAVAVASRSVV